MVESNNYTYIFNSPCVFFEIFLGQHRKDTESVILRQHTKRSSLGNSDVQSTKNIITKDKPDETFSPVSLLSLTTLFK